MVILTVPFGTLPIDIKFLLLNDKTTHANSLGRVEFSGPTVSFKELLFRRAQGTITPEPLLATVLSSGTRHSTL